MALDPNPLLCDFSRFRETEYKNAPDGDDGREPFATIYKR